MVHLEKKQKDGKIQYHNSFVICSNTTDVRLKYGLTIISGNKLVEKFHGDKKSEGMLKQCFTDSSNRIQQLDNTVSVFICGDNDTKDTKDHTKVDAVSFRYNDFSHLFIG